MKPHELDAFLAKVGAESVADYLGLPGRTAAEALDERMKWAAWHFRDTEHAEESQFLLTHAHALADLLSRGEPTWRARFGPAATILPVEELFAPSSDDSLLLDHSMIEPTPHPLRRAGRPDEVPPDPSTTGQFTFVDWDHLAPVPQKPAGGPTGPADAELSTPVQAAPERRTLVGHPAVTALALAVGFATVFVGAGFLAGVLLHLVTRPEPPPAPVPHALIAPLTPEATTPAFVPVAPAPVAPGVARPAPMPQPTTTPVDVAGTPVPAPAEVEEPLMVLGTWEGTGGFGDDPTLRLRLYTLNKGRVDGRLYERKGGMEAPTRITGTWDAGHLDLRGEDGRTLQGDLSGTTLVGEHTFAGQTRRWLVVKQP